METTRFFRSHGNSVIAHRRTMMTLVPQFTSDRMVTEYTRKYYLAKLPILLVLLLVVVVQMLRDSRTSGLVAPKSNVGGW